jgi:crotonobetainyl-CoA:carnitine CoA-transferase CaiB-like acyl-CoA transferase
MASGPLEGIKVLEFSQIIAGPFCCMTLSDMGAEVTKFEPVEGEPWRLFGEMVPKESRMFASLNRGKRGVAMDLSDPDAQAAVHALAKDADVVVINYRPGVPEALNIDYETLSAINPRLIYCENTAFGPKGPLSARPGYDIVVQALTGLMAGEAKVSDKVPEFVYPAIADFATGIQMANSISAALFARERTGKGQRIETTLMGTAMAIQTSQFTWIDAFDDDVFPAMQAAVQEARNEQRSFEEQVEIRSKFRPAATGGNIYYRVFQTSDGFVAVGALSMSLRLKVIAATGLSDPRFKPDGSFELMPPGIEEWGPRLVADAEALFATKTTRDWVEIMEKHGVPAGPMYFVDELFDHPQTAANNLVADVEHDLLGHMRMVGPAFQMSETPLEVQGASPVLGGANDDVLGEAGFSTEKIAAMRERGTIL